MHSKGLVYGKVGTGASEFVDLIAGYNRTHDVIEHTNF